MFSLLDCIQSNKDGPTSLEDAKKPQLGVKAYTVPVRSKIKAANTGIIQDYLDPTPPSLKPQKSSANGISVVNGFQVYSVD